MANFLLFLIKLIGIVLTIFGHTWLCIFLYKNYGVIPFIAYIVSISIIIFLIVIPLTALGEASFRRKLEHGLKYRRSFMIYLHKHGENYSTKARFLFWLCEIVVYILLGILYIFIENKYLATVLCCLLLFVITKILSRLFDKYATFYLKQ